MRKWGIVSWVDDFFVIIGKKYVWNDEFGIFFGCIVDFVSMFIFIILKYIIINFNM